MKIFYNVNILCCLQGLVLIIIFKKIPVLQSFTLYSGSVPKMWPQQEGVPVQLHWASVDGDDRVPIPVNIWKPIGWKESCVLEPTESCQQLES